MTWTRGPRHAPLLEVRALLRLLPTEQGGRHSPVRSRYHPDWDLGNTWTGEPTIHGGQVVLLGVDEVGPGEACDVVIEPLAAEFWCEVRVGSVIVAREGRRVVGHATVLAVASPVAGFSPTFGRFAARAHEYCAFVEQAAALELGERLRLARVRLLDLYRAGVDLPDVDVTKEEDAPPITVERPIDWPGFGAFEFYWEVFDPYEREEPACGELSDDVLDVYADVLEGLHLWRAGRWLEAAWLWRFTCRAHWGTHVTGALRALDRALRDDVMASDS
ncbi:MAG TPA: DUF5063 domain-containing protein [Myxococcota bacterium]|nr:DUF5063 domain-containing protein [Myxococcota bacterium]